MFELTWVKEEVVQACWEKASCSLEEWHTYYCQASNQGEDMDMSLNDIKIEAQASKGFDSFLSNQKKKKQVVVFEPNPVFKVYSPAF